MNDQNTTPWGLLFDNDGVLIDSCELHWKSWKALHEEAPNFKMTREDFLATFGQRNESIFEQFLSNAQVGESQRYGDLKEELFRQCADGKIELLPGMEEFLSEIKKQNIPRIIASSGPIKNLDFFLKRTAIGKYFDQYQSAEECKRGKPFPDVFLAAAKKIGINPEHCVVLEDSPSGLEAGRAAGCKVIALPTTHKKCELDSKTYDMIVDSPSDLSYDLVKSLALSSFTS